MKLKRLLPIFSRRDLRCRERRLHQLLIPEEDVSRVQAEITGIVRQKPFYIKGRRAKIKTVLFHRFDEVFLNPCGLRNFIEG
jgi:hypothetical protein